MKKLSTANMMWLAVGCILLVNTFILTKVYINRSHIVAQLPLSERELELPYNYGFAKEDSSIRVSLNWRTPNKNSIKNNNWHWQYDKSLLLSEAHFASFGFPTCNNNKHNRYKKMAWALLEFNGKNYADFVEQAERHYAFVKNGELQVDSDLSKNELAENIKNAEKFLEDAKETSTRLFVIDAAAKRELLEHSLSAHTADNTGRLIIVPAEIKSSYSRCNKDSTKSTEIYIANLAVESLYMPKELAERIEFNKSTSQKTHFIADIVYGQLYEPWINNVSR